MGNVGREQSEPPRRLPLSTIVQPGTMAEAEKKLEVPTPEIVLRDLAKKATKVIPRFEEKEAAAGVK